jgi:hypothetical protein
MEPRAFLIGALSAFYVRGTAGTGAEKLRTARRNGFHFFPFALCQFMRERGDVGRFVTCVSIKYPAAEKKRWDAVVTRISNSLSES